MKPIGTIEEERVDCVAAWMANSNATFAFNFHHGVHAESLPEPWEMRVAFTLSDKPENERAVRLRNFRPVIGLLPKKVNKAWADYTKAWADYVKAWADCDKAGADCEPELVIQHNAEWPDNTWNGKDIFSREA